MSLILDKKLINVQSDGDDDNYKINVADFIKSRHMNDVLNNYKTNNSNSNNNGETMNMNNKLQKHQQKSNNNNNNIVINKYNVDVENMDDVDAHGNSSIHSNNENSVINQSDYRTHFIRKFKETKSRISSRNQYSAIYVKQPNIERTWNFNHINNNNLLSLSTSNTNLANTNGSGGGGGGVALHSNSDLLVNESIFNTDNNNKYVHIGSLEKWSSHISKTTTNVNNNNNHSNNSSNNNNNNTNANSKKPPIGASTAVVVVKPKTPIPVTYNLLTHVISNPVERENTKESLNMQYDRPNDIHRDLIPTPHAYLKLNDEPSMNTNRKSVLHNQTPIVPTFTTATLSSISNKIASFGGVNNNSSTSNSTAANPSKQHFDQHILRDDMQTPDNYVTIETPSNNISIYSKLALPLSSTQNSISINGGGNNSMSSKTTPRNKNSTVAKDLINDSNSYSKRRNTFSITPNKNAAVNSNNVNQKKSISFRKPPKISEDMVPSRTSSPILEEPSIANIDKLFHIPNTSRRSKHGLFNPLTPSTIGSTSTTSSSLLLNNGGSIIKKPAYQQPQQQQSSSFKSSSNTNISPRKVVFNKKALKTTDKFLKPRFDPNNCELKEFKHCIITDLKIGEGEFGETFQGYRYDLGAPVKIAAKRLKNVKPNGEIDTSNLNPLMSLNNPNISVTNTNTENILAEVCVLSQLGKHDFVIDYLGVHNYSDTMYMIFEFAEKGDLKRLLDNCRKNSRPEININLLWKMKFAYEISAGMEYIASLGIVHKDLAARNILMQKDYTCKIADFGCCRTDFMVKRPIRWMSPESLNKSLFTSASDVWSFGIILWEIWTLGVIPYPGMTDDEVVSRINQWYRLYKPHDCPNEIYNIMSQCWKEYYRARPRFSQIAHRIKDLYETVLENKGILPVIP